MFDLLIDMCSFGVGALRAGLVGRMLCGLFSLVCWLSAGLLVLLGFKLRVVF